jgi:hypothetical protein
LLSHLQASTQAPATDLSSQHYLHSPAAARAGRSAIMIGAGGACASRWRWRLIATLEAAMPSSIAAPLSPANLHQEPAPSHSHHRCRCSGLHVRQRSDSQYLQRLGGSCSHCTRWRGSTVTRHLTHHTPSSMRCTLEDSEHNFASTRSCPAPPGCPPPVAR